MYLFDTNVLSEITNRRPNRVVVQKLMACDPALRFASEITRYELRYGAGLLPPGVGVQVANAYRELRRAQHRARLDEQPTQVPPEDMAAECAAIVRLWDAVF